MRDKYKTAGVDLNEAGVINKSISKLVGKFKFENTLSKIGDFGGIFQINKDDYDNPVLVSSVDGVGTKIDIAIQAGINNTIGMDIVNHCVNDILVCGAYPMFFMDYIAYTKAEPQVIVDVIDGIVKACAEKNIPLL